MNLRELKERSFGAPAEVLAKLHVHPNLVTAIGVVFGLLAESMTVAHQKARANTSESEEISEGTLKYWLVTLLRVLSLVADGMDGSVARAREELDSEFENPYGQIVDGVGDRALVTIRQEVESHQHERNGERGTAIYIAILAVLTNVPSYLRAKIEANGGVTKDQALNPLEFAGTQFGRMAILIITSLDFSQVQQLLALASPEKELTIEQWEKIKLVLWGYMGLSTVAVIVKRLRAYVISMRNKPIDQVVAGALLLIEATDSEASEKLIADSSGFVKKTAKDHEIRAKAYSLAIIISALCSAALVASMTKKKRDSR
ncbi:CDP-alcohol phosphatidyltransferase family protein [Candidatus Woesebacteria bacterium]|nr:CDP-alcohol phosphatidyltransferase family protein [Candidatus Woesebacteria bacterium]